MGAAGIEPGKQTGRPRLEDQAVPADRVSQTERVVKLNVPERQVRHGIGVAHCSLVLLAVVQDRERMTAVLHSCIPLSVGEKPLDCVEGAETRNGAVG
jgi:hypothetical protein